MKNSLSPLLSNAGLAAGALLGLPLGLFGLPVGLILGFMVDTVRAERGFRAWLVDPGARDPDEAMPGLAAALALAAGFAEGLEPPTRQAIRRGLVAGALAAWRPAAWRPAAWRPAAWRPAWLRPPPRWVLHRPWPGAIHAVLDEAPELDQALLARRLALGGSLAARRLLADLAWSYEAARGVLTLGRNEEVTARLAEAGVDASTLLLARARSFPGWRSPWELLGLQAGADAEAIRRAWRETSKLLHPDLAGEGAGEEGFRRAKEAYEILMARAGTGTLADRGQ